MAAMKSFVLKIFMLTVGILLALVIFECIARLFNLAPMLGVVQKGRYRLSADPKIGYEPEPNLNYEGKDLSFYDWHGQTNNLGYRDYQHSIEKDPNVYRIIVLGDSVGQGFYIENYEETFAPVLEKLLHKAGKNAEILNFSVSGYNTMQEVETLKEKALIYKPDLVIVAYCLNDTNQVDGGILSTLLSQKGSKALAGTNVNELLLRSYLYRIVRYKLLASKVNYDALSQNTVALSLQALGSISKDKGFKVLIDVFPEFGNLKDYTYQNEHDFIKKSAAENNFQYLDLLPAFTKCQNDSPNPISFDIFHPTAYGDYCAANATADYIINQIR